MLKPCSCSPQRSTSRAATDPPSARWKGQESARRSFRYLARCDSRTEQVPELANATSNGRRRSVKASRLGSGRRKLQRVLAPSNSAPGRAGSMASKFIEHGNAEAFAGPSGCDRFSRVAVSRPHQQAEACPAYRRCTARMVARRYSPRGSSRRRRSSTCRKPSMPAPMRSNVPSVLPVPPGHQEARSSASSRSRPASSSRTTSKPREFSIQLFRPGFDGRRGHGVAAQVGASSAVSTSAKLAGRVPHGVLERPGGLALACFGSSLGHLGVRLPVGWLADTLLQGTGLEAHHP